VLIIGEGDVETIRRWLVKEWRTLIGWLTAERWMQISR